MPLMRFDRAWTRVESRLAAWLLVSEIAALCLWVALKGLSAEYQTGSGDKNVSGLVFRSLLTAVALGLGAHFFTRPNRGGSEQAVEGFHAAQQRNRLVVTSSACAGLFLGRLWANAGVEYFSNVLNWMQNASVLMLIGGLRGVVTRLTLWLALLGGSIATAKGRHINIDVVMRFMTPKMRIPVAVLGWMAAAVMCVSGAWGFVDHIAVALFHMNPSEGCQDDRSATSATDGRSPASPERGQNQSRPRGPHPEECPVPPGAKLARIAHEMRTHVFLVGRQLSLDVRTFPRVLVGTKYDEYFRSSDWNAWVKGADWSAHFPAGAVAGLLIREDDTDKQLPAVTIPGGEEVRGLLIKDADLVFPFGLLMIACRFLLRSLLALAGQIRVDPDAAHEEDSEVSP
jgi:TRAP-type C4-dicarboxylate transport system permease small subunit